ncbi:MAG: response regulator [Bacteriovoracaceae bacterium]|nr:response regulator [Bacteriovoracaceae bacterium]
MKQNLLIIDDEDLILHNLKYLLKKHALTVFTANNGKAGLNILQKNQIHCVICDIFMPDLTGVQIIKEVRAMGNMVPFVFFTAHGNHDLMLEAAKYGAFEFINKPYFESLEEIIINGLREGFERSSTSNILTKENEYQEILDMFLAALKDTNVR